MSATKINVIIAIIGALTTVLGAAVAATVMVKDAETLAKVNEARVVDVEAAVVKIESKLDYLVEGQSQMRADVQGLKVDIGHVKETLRGRPN